MVLYIVPFSLGYYYIYEISTDLDRNEAKMWHKKSKLRAIHRRNYDSCGEGRKCLVTSALLYSGVSVVGQKTEPKKMLDERYKCCFVGKNP